MENKKTSFTFEEVLQQSLEYFNGDDLAARIWINKYALKDAEGNIYEKSPVDMHHRLARELARIESKYPNPIGEDRIFSLLDHFRYIVPAGSPMMGIGNDFPQGGQIDWVLGKFSDEEMLTLRPAVETAVQVVKSFVLAGIDVTMNLYNNKGKSPKQQ